MANDVSGYKIEHAQTIVEQTKPLPPKTVATPKKVPEKNVPAKKVSVINGPLYNVVPHPKIDTKKAKKKARMRAVAKAKEFSGILKNTALDVTKN